MTTWNKFCFTGGIFETSVQLPGANNIVGLWPAIWAMGNLGGNVFSPGSDDILIWSSPQAALVMVLPLRVW